MSSNNLSDGKKKTALLADKAGECNEIVLKEWMIDRKHIQSGGLVGEKIASDESLAEIASLLNVIDVISLSCSYDFSSYQRGCYVLQCSFLAKVRQQSIYSLKIVEREIESSFTTELFQRKDEEEGGQFYLRGSSEEMEDVDQDFFDNDEIELGRLVFEFLSLELDNFVFEEGESEKWSAQNSEQEQKNKRAQSPFAALKNLPVKKG